VNGAHPRLVTIIKPFHRHQEQAAFGAGSSYELRAAWVAIRPEAEVLRLSQHLCHVVEAEPEHVRPTLADVRDALTGYVDVASPPCQASRELQARRDHAGQHDVGRSPGHPVKMRRVRSCSRILLLRTGAPSCAGTPVSRYAWPGWPAYDGAALSEAFRRAMLRLLVRRG